MRLTMDARARRVLRRLPPVSVYSLAELALLAALAIQVARLVWAVATPVAPLGDWRPAGPTLAGSPYDILTGFDPFFRLSGGDAPAAATVTSLQLTLFGTRIDEAMGRGSAIIAGPDGVQKSVAVGEEIAPGVKLKQVAFDHVTLDRGGASEDLFLDQSGAAPVASASTAATASPPPIAGAPAGAPGAGGAAGLGPQLRNEIGFIPRLDSGRISGLVVRPQGSGTLFRRAGLQEGDVVTAVGGRPVSSAADLDRVVADAGAGGAIPITVERGGRTLPLSIAVAPTR